LTASPLSIDGRLRATVAKKLFCWGGTSLRLAIELVSNAWEMAAVQQLAVGFTGRFDRPAPRAGAYHDEFNRDQKY
jgi:hypothetical protein